ncbi:phage protein [Caudoviricetes sp.]|nr:phage protein [Caudoviricetes sp.]UOF81491.1 phage protein [Caudoviricetes sp.]
MKNGVKDGLLALALMAQGEAQKSILRGPKTGRVYKRGKGFHQASAPGEAPANDLGFLANNVKAEMTDDLVASTFSLAPYSVHLEYGTRKMAARPFLRPAVEKVKAQAQGVLNAYIKNAT